MNRRDLGAVQVVSMTLLIAAIQTFMPLEMKPDTAYAQEELNDTINSVRVVGNQRIEKETIVSYLKTAVGDRFDSSRIDESLKTLFKTGLFADVSMRREDRTLIVQVVENPIINRIAFEGNRYIKDGALASEVQLRPRVVYTRTKVQKDLTRLLEVYRRSGRFSARVVPRVIQLEQNRVDLVFEIKEGARTGVQRIVFVGNRVFRNGKLREVIQTKQSRWWRFLSTADAYDPDRMNYDQELLRRFYVNEGFADFQVTGAIAELTPDREKFFITFSVEEGRRYRFDEILVNSDLPNLNTGDLFHLVTTTKGDWYDAADIENTVQRLTQAVGEIGYAFVDVQPRVKRNRDNSTISVTYDIGEGNRIYVERVNITGNVRTLDRVIRRNVRLAEGDAFNAAKVRRSRQLINDLGFFSSVNVENQPGSGQDRSILNIDVSERSTGELSFGAGFSSDAGVLASAGIRERNLLGRGQNLSLNFQLSGITQNIQASFTEPYFLNREILAGFDLFNTTYQFTESAFERDVLGFGLRFGYPLTEYLSQQIRYGLKNEKFLPFSGNTTTSQSQSLLSSVGQTVFYNKLDHRLNPSEGYFFRVSNDLAGLGGDREWFRSRLEAGQYKPLWFEWIGSLVGEVGYISGLGGQQVLILDRFFLGGQNFRGFQRAGVGPRDLLNGNALGGNLLYKATSDMTFPVGLPKELGIRGRIFSTVGTLTEIDEAITSNLGDTESLRVSLGIGISWDSPFGPIQLNYARPIRSEVFDEEEFISFGVGSFF
ncbi:MAG: outer membrane protein assembly factor BamA [Alphaproteobacteria bacterium]